MGTKTKLKIGLTMAFLTIIAILLTFPQVVNAVTQEWVRRYDGPGRGYKLASAITVDSIGNVFITCTSMNTAGNWDYATIKYSSAGVRQWVRRYDGPGKSADQANAITVDTNGNVFVTGSSMNEFRNYDYATIKYNSAGVRQWIRRYDGPLKGEDQAKAIAVDPTGNVYVTGNSRNASGGYRDYATIKYNSAGKRLWVRRYNAKGSDYSEAIAVDNIGNAYVTGYSWNITTRSWDYVTIKYNSAGNRQWVRRYDGPGKRDDYATAIAVDTKGNVYVTGRSWNVVGDSDYVTIKYSSSGNRQWVRRYNGPGNGYDYASAIVVDTKGNILVTGSSMNATGFRNYTTIKYNSAGNRQWVRNYNVPGKTASASAIAVDTNGNAYVTGESVNNAGNFDYATIRYNSTGNQQWVRRYDGPGKGYDYASAIVVDTKGNILVTGSSMSAAGNFDYTTIKYAP